MRKKSKKFTKALLCALLSGGCLSPTTATAQEDNGQTAYAYSIGNDYGIVSFQLNSFTPSVLHTESGTISAGAFAEGRYYALHADEEGNPIGLFEHNLKTGESKQINDMSDAPSIFMDMTYDYTTSTLYAIADEWPGTSLLKIELPSGKLSFVYNVDKMLFTLAANEKGELFCMEKDGTIYQLGETADDIREVAQNDFYLNGLQSMDFDLNTGKLYWLTTSYGNCSLMEIDPETWTPQSVGGIKGAQISGLYTGYTLAEPESPSAPTQLTLTPGAEGANACTIAWTNPTITFNRNDLNSLDNVHIYRNGKLLATLDNPTAGSAGKYEDTDVPSGLYTYKVTATNEAGEGMFAIARTFVGEDVPVAPAEVTATVSGESTVILNWKAPQEGIHGGWVTSDLSYRVTRVNDNQVLAEDLKETTFTDHIEGAFAAYTYTVTAYSKAGEGGTATSNTVGAGQTPELPLDYTFSTQEELDTWFIYDEDGNGKCWVAGSGLSGSTGAETYFQKGSDSDDWLISPAVQIQAGNTMQVAFKVYTAYYPTEKLEIRLLKGNTPDAETVYSKQLEVNSYYGKDIQEDIPAVSEDGKYHLAFRYVSPGDTYSGWGIHITNLYWKEQNSGVLTGRVTSGGQPLAGAVITAGETSVTTNQEGVYELAELKAGSHDITARALGYQEAVETIEMSAGQTITCDFELTALPVHRIGGTVTDESQSPIAGAQISLSGYNQYTTTTGADGTFVFEEVYEHTDYRMRIAKNNFIIQEMDCPTESDRQENITLKYDNLPPYQVTAAEGNGKIQVSWTAPKSLEERAYDNGYAESSMGYDGGSEYHVVGTIYREPATVYEVKWQTVAGGVKSDRINIYLFDLNYAGEPTSDILYSIRDVKTEDGTWNTFRLPEAVKAPKGFLVAVSAEGNVALAIDGGTPDGSIQHPMTQCYNTDYRFERGYRYVDETSNPSRCFLLRAVCENLEEEGSTQPRVDYTVWRVPVQPGSEEDETSWTQIGNQLEETRFEDTDIPSGTYRYAVKAHYPVGDLTSTATFSNETDFNMNAALTVNVTANSDNAHAEGAVVSLSNDEFAYQAVVTNNQALFERIAKGTYTLSVEQTGFKRIQETEVVLTGEESAFTRNYELEQRLDKPRNIDLLPTDKQDEVRLLWNVQENLADDFESDAYEDFSINPAGNIGWQYIDNDNLATYGFGNTTFPNMRERMAAILFNSTQTTPPLGLHTAYSGDHCLAFFAARETVNEGGEIQLHDSDDYLISPLLNPYKDFQFRFFARSYEESQGYLERIRVGYSTTTPEIDQFIWLDEDYFYVPTEYTEYTYDIPKEAKYVVLNSHSISNFILLVDDVFIGNDSQKTGNEYMPVNVTGYKVYLDGRLLEETTETELLLTGLTPGEHTAAVVQKFATGESEMLEIGFKTEGSGIVWENTPEIRVYTEGDELHIDGAYQTATVYSATGAALLHLDGQATVGTSQWTPGIYLVRVVSEDGQARIYKITIE